MKLKTKVNGKSLQNETFILGKINKIQKSLA